MKSGIVMDWDGTVLNSMGNVMKAYSVLLDKPLDYVLKNYDPDWKEFLRREGVKEPSREEWKILLDRFENELFEGASEYLKKAHNDKYRLAIVTSSNSLSLNSDLKKFNLDGLFETYVTFEDVKNIKPHPEGINIAMKRLDVTPKECVYVGDTVVDAVASKNAGVDFVGVSWGILDSLEDIRNVDREKIKIAHSFEELYNIIKEL